MKKTIIISGIILGIFIIGILVFAPQNKLGNVPLNLTSTNTSSTVVSATVTLVMDEKSDAQIRTIANIGNAIVYLSFNNATSSGFIEGTGYVLYASSTGAGSKLEMTEALGNLWTGKIWGRTTAGTSTLSMSQL